MPLAVNNQKTYDDRERNLFSLSDGLRMIYLCLAILMLVAGLILGVMARDYYDEFRFVLFLSTFLPYGIAGLIIWAVGRVACLLLEAFADIHYYLRISAAGAEVNASKAEVARSETPTGLFSGIRNDSEWKCQKCGRVNKKYVTTCVCGQSQSKN